MDRIFSDVILNVNEVSPFCNALIPSHSLMQSLGIYDITNAYKSKKLTNQNKHEFSTAFKLTPYPVDRSNPFILSFLLTIKLCDFKNEDMI